MSFRPARLRVPAAAAAVVALATVMSAPADAATTTTSDAPHGYLVKTVPNVMDVVDTTAPGSLFIAPGAKTVHVGKHSIHLGLTIHFKDGNEDTYGVQELINGKWIDMVYMTRVDPRDGCAMGGSNWSVQAFRPGTVRVRGFSREDGHLLGTPSYKVTILPKS